MGIERFLLVFYSGMLRLYPLEFRREFGAEMKSVFAEALSVSRGCGVRAVLCLMGDEIRHLPGSLLREYREASWEREVDMDKSTIDMSIRSVNNRVRSPISWGEAFLAALPYVLILILDTLPKLLVLAGLLTWESVGMQVLNITMMVLFSGIFLLVLVMAVRRGWPLWSASWYIFFWLLVLLPLGWLLSMVVYGRSEYQVQEVILYLILPLMMAVMLYWVTRTDRLRGLLAALPILYFLWLPNMEQTPRHIIPDQLEILIKAASTVLVVMAVMALVRLRDWRKGYWIVLGTILLVGLQFAYVGIYHGGTLPFIAPGPSLVEVVKSFIPQYLAACSILLGPLFARMFRETGRRSGTAGKIGYHLALLGLLLIIAVNLLGLMIGTTDAPGYAVGLTYTRLGWLIYSALVVYIAGLLLLYLAAWRSGVLPGVVEMVLLALLPMAIPLMFVLPFITWKWPVSRLYGVPALWVIPETMILAAGLIWLLLSSWLVTRKKEMPSLPVVLSYDAY